jgi:hypothetical protein
MTTPLLPVNGAQQVRISPLLETLLAPALLPRGYINQQLLLAIREVRPAAGSRSANRCTN